MAGGNGNKSNNSSSSSNGSNSSSGKTGTLFDYLNLGTRLDLDLALQFQILWIFFAAVAGISVWGLLLHLRNLHKNTSDICLFRFIRYVIPVIAAVVVASLHSIKIHNVAHFAYIIALGVALPLGLAVLLLFKGFSEHWKRAVPTTIAWLLWIGASIFTTHWYWHYKITHSGGYDTNPHLTVRNGTLVPLWIITVVVTIVSFFWGRYQVREEARKEKEPLLPQQQATAEPTTVQTNAAVKKQTQTDGLTKSADPQKRRFFPWQKQETEEAKRTFRLPWSKKTEEKVKRKGFFA